jgi:hypothetical protein
MKISISNGINEFKEKQVSSMKEIGELACSSNISTSLFLNGYRNKQNFYHADFIGLDIDNDKDTETLSLQKAKEIFSGFKHVILSSKSHNLAKNGVVRERFRVILTLSEPITKSEDFYSTWFYLKSQFPWIDSQCKDPSRFWYQHGDILQYKEDGLLVKPIPSPTNNEIETQNINVLPGQRGELAKDTLNFLEFGVQSGSRNGTTHKVARDFNQSLYPHAEAEKRIIDALKRNEVICHDFPEEEAKQAIRSAYSKAANHAPRLADVKPRAFNYQSWSDVLSSEDKEEDWLIKGLLIRGGMSVVVGVPKIGKTTIVRQLEKSVLRGEPFLNRDTIKGRVLHYSFDEKARTAKNHYIKLGLTNEDDIVLHFGAASNGNYFKELEEDLLKIKPILVIVDTMFDMVDVQDVNSYGPVKRQLAQFSSLAERCKCHIMFIHHQNKPNQNYSKGSGSSVLGSTAILGSVDACLIFEKDIDSNLRTLKVEGRGVEDFHRVYLAFDKDKMIYKITEKGISF